MEKSFAWVFRSVLLVGVCAITPAESTSYSGEETIVLAATSPSAPKPAPSEPASIQSEPAPVQSEELSPTNSLIPPSFPTDMLWVARSLNGTPYTMESDRPTFTLTSSKTVIGFSGCNRFTSTAQWNPEALDIRPFALTRMTCSPEKMAMENAYLSVLRSVNRWSKDKHGMLKLSGEKGILIFERALIAQ